ncbi:hypothetical protein Pla110_40830 [Polystyrenella longa]|uniref:Uncharacterized protein n=1 Tax=Polystyrenella longa TaxID=2528007 RepID=A0A518CSX5_9PLAN|nr:hypothetical protein [Polystyrenella longa]QDU82328.1 hypothetical protein Pla110_40830 [Polystyrenella longa]
MSKIKTHSFKDSHFLNKPWIRSISCVLMAQVSLLLTLSSPLLGNEKESTSEKTLFAFDDHSIPWKNNLKLTMVKPEKHASNPLIPRGEKGAVDEWAVQYYGSTIKHDGLYKTWYIAADNESLELIKKGKGFSGLRPAYAESDDGIHWRKPNLGLVEYNGSKNNNLVLIDPPDVAGIHLIVIHEEDDPDPTRQFKMLLTVSAYVEGSKGSSTITLFSEDGLSWRSPTPLHFEEGYLPEEDLILPSINFEQGGLFKYNGMYHLPGQQFSPSVWQPDGKRVGRVMVTLRSRDLIHWEESTALGFIRGTAIGKVGKVSEDEEAHLASSIWNRGNVQLGVYGLWHGAQKWQERGLDLGFMLSNNGIHFREPERDYVFISAGEEGSWDEGGLLQGQGFHHIGDRTYVYYGSWDLTKPSYPPRGGVGAVSVERDRFGFLSAFNSEREARFVTAPVEPEGKSTKVILNVDQIDANSSIRIELLDELSQPIPGYSGSDAGTVSESGFHQVVNWPKSNSGIINLKKPYSIRVLLPEGGEAQFFALYVSN